ncbi:MAG: CHAD domain-containing protein [Methylorubrum rhodinum]|uniref:CYTH and CHAD domain-containing protein n=1 Tax=Methylorubrum rhodinum TaxID=29428 RepID=UPI003BB15D41
MTASREIELKLDCDAADLAALADHPLLHSPDAGHVTLHATYYDTDAGDLRAAGLALRVRRETGPDGERVIQTVKAGADGAGLFDRAEWERTIPGPAPDRAALDDTPAGEVLKEAGEPEIAARFSLVIERAWRPVRYGASAIAVTLDRGRIETVRGDLPVCEAELELTEGDPADLFALAQALCETVPLRLGALAKGERGEAALAGRLDRPSKADRVAIDPGTTAGEGFAAVARSCLRHLRLNEAVFLENRDPEALHQIRVALRRLRSAFTLFRPVLAADPRAVTLRDEIKRVTEPFGRARNLDVFLDETLAPEIERRPEEAGLHDLRALLGAERERAYAAVLAILDGAAWRGLVIDCVAWIEAGPWRGPAGTPEGDRAAKNFAADVLERLRRRIKQRGRHLDRLEAEERHRVRIEAKKLRYGAEFFAGLYAHRRKDRKRHKAFVAALAELQDHLGALNDIATAHEIGAGLAPPERGAADGFPDPAAAVFSAGLVAADVEARTRSLLAAAAQAHEDLLEVRPFWR